MPLSYHRAVLFPKDERKAIRLLALAVTASIVITVISYVIVGIARLVWPDVAEQSGMGVFFWFVPMGALLIALRTIAATACIRCSYFATIATADFVESAVAAFCRILWGLLLTSSALGLLFGYTLGVLIAASVCAFPIVRWTTGTQTSVSISDLQLALVEFRDYPIYRAPAKFAFSGAQRMPVIALGIIFPAEVVGFYAMANRAAAMPLAATSQAVKDVLLPRIMGKRQNDQPIVSNLVKVALGLAITGAPVFITLYFLGEGLFSWFLGQRWAAAGRMVEILSPYLFMVWIGSFTATVFESLRLNKLRLQIHVGNLLVRIGIFVFSASRGMDIESTLWLFVLVSCCYQFLIYTVAARVAVKYDAGLTRESDENHIGSNHSS